MCSPCVLGKYYQSKKLVIVLKGTDITTKEVNYAESSEEVVYAESSAF